MDKKWLIALVPGVFALVLGVFIIALFLVKLLWAWTIPDLFPGAVEQGLVAKEISCDCNNDTCDSKSAM